MMDDNDLSPFDGRTVKCSGTGRTRRSGITSRHGDAVSVDPAVNLSRVVNFTRFLLSTGMAIRTSVRGDYILLASEEQGESSKRLHSYVWRSAALETRCGAPVEGNAAWKA